MAWTHPPKASDLHLTDNPDLELARKEKAMPLKKHLAPCSGGRNKEDELRLGTLERLAQGQGCLKSSEWRPVLQWEPKAMVMRS